MVFPAALRRKSAIPLKVAFWAAIAVATWAQLQEPSVANFGSVDGQVIDAATGAPVRKATLTLWREHDPFHRTTAPGPGGSFEFQNVPPGEYTVSAAARGYLEFTQSSGSRVTITLATGQTLSGILLRLKPQAAVSGRIFDEDGDPLAKVEVQLWRVTYADGLRKLERVHEAANTDDRGWFRIPSLVPGKYYVSASPSDRTFNGRPNDDARYARTFYPGTFDPMMASPVDLKSGDELDKVDMKLRKIQIAHVTGRVLSALPATVSLYPDNSFSNFHQATVTAVPEGAFAFSDVLPGSYHLQVRIHEGEQDAWAFQPISVGSGGLDDVTIAPNPAVSVRGTVTVEGEGTTIDFSKVAIRLRWVDYGGGVETVSKVQGDGTFEMDDLPPGKYRVSCTLLPPGFYLRALKSGGQDLPERVVDVGTSSQLEVLLSPKAASVTGTVLSPDSGKPAPRAAVVLVPQERERAHDPTLYPIFPADSSGKFAGSNIPPGEYKAFAWESVDPGEKVFMDPDFIRPVEAAASAVSLVEGGRADIKVRLILDEAR
jgi:hypothetical protein